MRKLFLLFIYILIFQSTYSQVGIGTVGGFDFYQRYTNPKDGIAYPSSGNVLLNLIYGPKIWFGGKGFSVSLEGQVNLGLTSLAIKDFKGLGAVSFPVLAKLNFKGLSGFHTGFATGFSLGGGIAWTKTELYYLDEDYKNKNVSRDFFNTIFGQIDIGVGSFGTDGTVYFRYGTNVDTKAKILNIGLLVSSNKLFKKKMNKINNKEKIKDK